MRQSVFLRRLLALWLIAAASLLAPASPMAADKEDPAFEQARRRMVRVQLEERGIRDTATLKAMAEVPRHLFVAEDLRDRAYADGPLPIGYAQTISQPLMVATMTELIHPAAGMKVLEIGTGSGYQAAVLAAAGAQVYSIEIIPELAESAAGRLRRLGYEDIRLRQADGYFGWPEAAPFDAILVTAAAPFVPPPLVEQLKEGGRMLIPLGSPFLMQTLMLVEKVDGSLRSRSLMPVRFVPFLRQP